jgi:hypothetical protein
MHYRELRCLADVVELAARVSRHAKRCGNRKVVQRIEATADLCVQSESSASKIDHPKIPQRRLSLR